MTRGSAPDNKSYRTNSRRKNVEYQQCGRCNRGYHSYIGLDCKADVNDEEQVGNEAYPLAGGVYDAINPVTTAEKCTVMSRLLVDFRLFQ